MKNRKWLTYTLGALLTLIALAVVAVAGFRIGMMQTAGFPRMGIDERPAFDQNVDKNDPRMQGFDLDQDGRGNMIRGNHFNPWGFDRGHRGMPILGGFFGLIQIAVLALLLWFGYTLFQNSGWRLVRVENNTPTTSGPVSTEVEEKKESK